MGIGATHWLSLSYSDSCFVFAVAHARCSLLQPATFPTAQHTPDEVAGLCHALQQMQSGEAAGKIVYEQLVEGTRGPAKLYHVAKL